MIKDSTKKKLQAAVVRRKEGIGMAVILLIFIGFMCLSLGVRVYNSEERASIFTKYPIQVTDVKKYNHFCAALIIGFGLVAEVTMFFMITNEGLLSALFMVLIIAEAFIVMAIYRAGEKKFLQKR